MKSRTSAIVAMAFVLTGSCALAEDRAASQTNYFVAIDQGEVVTQPDGTRIRIGQVSHANGVDDNTGEQVSAWCYGQSVLGNSDAPVAGAGYCAQVDDDGDIAWFSFRNYAGQNGTWTAMGGTGKYEGQTGSGTSENISNRGDGRGWTSKAKGKITTP